MDSVTARKVCADLRCGELIKHLDHDLDERETGSRTTWNLMSQNMSDPILRPAVCAQRKVAQVRCQIEVTVRDHGTPVVSPGACRLACKLPRAALSSDAVALRRLHVPASSLPVRLSGSGAARCSGIVEVSLSGSWRGLCGGQGWSLETASVICRELNCQEALEIQPARIGNDKEIQGVSCPENKDIRQCHDHLEERRCSPARVICTSKTSQK
ncbi:UNVERIFIED_CONTAM: hypothetical protein FKN15_006297 [Acipenser sinensis]